MRDLYNYKSLDADEQTRRNALSRLQTLLYLSLEQHLKCLTGVNAIATVPSSGGRSGPHPIDEMRSMFADGFEQIILEYRGPSGLERNQRRVLDPARFGPSEGTLLNKRVLLLDDAWVSGVHMQSAAAALKLAGAELVFAVPIGRVVSPNYGGAKDFLADNPPQPFDPAICPLSGERH